VSFSGFTLDTTTRQLQSDEGELHLSPKAFDLLAILLTNRPGVVPKDILRDKLWPGTNVVDANLNNLVSEIRSALGDDPQRPRFIRTVHRVGYAFVGVGAGSEEGHSRVGAGSERGQSPATRAWLVWNDRTILLTEESQILGRDPGCHIWIDAPGVSRRHARILLARDGATPAGTIEDLDSTNGTFVDGRRVRPSAPLEDGQSIRMGDATLTFRASSEAGAATKRIRRRP
jgi:DNA-binding winged helix-turn-helix (wHTH) protein